MKNFSKKQLYDLALNLQNEKHLSILVAGDENSFHLSIISFPSHEGSAFYIDDTVDINTINELIEVLKVFQMK